MVDKKIVEEWLEKAGEDLGYATSSLDDELEFFAQICFHFQQAAEKYLKAYIVCHTLEFKKIHDLLELLEICCGHDPNLNDLKESCVFLNRFYVTTRYPVHWMSNFCKKDAVNARQAAEIIANRINNLLCNSSSIS